MLMIDTYVHPGSCDTASSACAVTAMIVRPGQPSKMYSLSMASGQAGQVGQAKLKAKAKPQSKPRVPRRESPLAAAARRAREAMAGPVVPRNDRGSGGSAGRPSVNGTRSRSPSGSGRSGLSSTPKLRKPLGADPPPPTPCTPESPQRSERPHAAPRAAYAARSLIHQSPDRDLDKHPSRRPPGSYSPESPSPGNGRRKLSTASEDHDPNADFADTSVGSALIDAFSEDPAMSPALPRIV